MDNRSPRTKGATRYTWPEVTNVAEPKHIFTDFDTDDGTYVEENGVHKRRIENSRLILEGGKEGALAYMQVYEKNVTYKARFMYTDSEPSGAYLGFVLRYTSPYAYVRVSYHSYSKCWALMESEGRDHYLYRHIEIHDRPIEAGEWHDIEFTADGKTASAYLDGALLFTYDGLDHTPPGRIGIESARMTLSVDSADAALLSGQGTLMKNVIHNKLPDEEYREGGTVMEMSDKTLRYIHRSGLTFDSTDNGITWERREIRTKTHGYPNMLRLRSGEIVKIVNREHDGVKYRASEISTDDGASWQAMGLICTNPYKVNTTAKAINMNDKVTEISTGRIFYCQNYEYLPWSTAPNGRTVFCEFYYSDDKGATWTKSETDSYGIEGAEELKCFGECKILECADGTLRMYNSYNDVNCMVYSESTDGGKTWGKLSRIPELVCSRSSMQFCRDPYADNETTYYMVWVFSPTDGGLVAMTRSRLSLARSTDGKSWTYLGDLWRWEDNNVVKSHICHIVDPFVSVNETHVICGSGCSEHSELGDKPDGFHHAQRQHIYSIPKTELHDMPIPKI